MSNTLKRYRELATTPVTNKFIGDITISDIILKATEYHFAILDLLNRLEIAEKALQDYKTHAGFENITANRDYANKALEEIKK